ncbi:fatty-acyl-CoA synthase [Paraphoma chrysanthemicola]|uniref:Very long-chain fatty acid transport protein n=1 Tax=Paraphoma chrysanthemicola TaxID=798071 RepID=A0A8K0R112_9PLEO|nr:fatty-acyl-CoA synthase [Paraphoma chrysanthemicola]
MALATAAAIVAGGWAGSLYLDGKYHLRKDLQALSMQKKAEKEYARVVREDKVNLFYVLEETCKERWNQEAIWSREKTYSYGELYESTVRYAELLISEGVKPGDLVALYLINSPHFYFVWLAAIAIGAAPAFLNYNLEGKTLLHCLGVSQARLMIADDDEACQQRLNGSQADIEALGTRIIVMNDRLKDSVASLEAKRPGDELRSGAKGDDPFTLIYTSGTTGLPKGCAFTFRRIYTAIGHKVLFCDCVSGVDRLYNPMPLYHGTGGITSVTCLLQGVSVAIAPKFSVSKFWDDVHESQSTGFIYVGETARYLVNAPTHPLERNHKLRFAYGNGLRPDVWEKFQSRFNIPEIGEFFNSTEGMFGLFNHDKGPFLKGCVGHHGLLLRSALQNAYIPVRIDYESGDIWRDPETGFAKRESYNEGGEMLVAVPNKQVFQGYWQATAATDKKFVTNVFKKGDLYYRSGDALRRDDQGRWFFLDRLGDTFRWKAENVSTAEVALAIGQFPGIAEANVYGVQLPNHDGRAGCAAIHCDPNYAGPPVDYNDLLKHLRTRLPRYAIPIFLRLVKASTHIHNFKQNKVPLRKEGVDPELIGTEAVEGRDDVLLWLSPKSNCYVPFERKDWEDINNRRASL